LSRLVGSWPGGCRGAGPASDGSDRFQAAASRLPTCETDGLVSVDPSPKRTVGTVKFPSLMPATIAAPSACSSMSISLKAIPARESCDLSRMQKPHHCVVKTVGRSAVGKSIATLCITTRCVCLFLRAGIAFVTLLCQSFAQVDRDGVAFLLTDQFA